MASRPVATVEVPAAAQLPGGPLAYTLRRSPRSRGLRVTIDPARGVVVTIPPPGRRGWARADARVTEFLSERESWVRHHVRRQERLREELAARGGLHDGGQIRYRGELHRFRIEPPAGPARRSTVSREGDLDGDLLVLRLGQRDRREPARVVMDWCRERAREAIDHAIAEHAAALAVQPAGITLRDPRTRWGSASRQRTLSFSWRLILAPPEAWETVVVHELAHLRIFGHTPRFWELVASRRPDHATWRRWLRQHSYELHAAFEPTG
jgi:predicted metal-dependent hydrolase